MRKSHTEVTIRFHCQGREMPIKNYTTGISFMKSIGEIQGCLVAHHASAIMINYEGTIPTSLTFCVETPNGKMAFQLPSNIDGVHRAMEKHRLPARYSNRDHAARVAWRIVKDWVLAQMAILEAEMVSIEEIFLPYLLTDGKQTLYQAMLDKGFPQLETSEG